MPDNSTKFNPNLHLDIPKWINEKYFENILKNDVANFKKILKFSTIPATPPGENYTSIMLRIKMDIELDGKYCLPCLLMEIFFKCMFYALLP